MDSQLLISKEKQANLQTSWKIYKLHWKTFLSLTGFIFIIFVIYFLLDLILSTLGIAPLFSVDSYTYGAGSIIASWLARFPIYLVYLLITSLLTMLFMVVPSLYFTRNEIITWKVPYQVLIKNIIRYFLAGFLFTVALTLGYLFCIIPGILITFITPVYVNKITCSKMTITESFSSSFQSVFRSKNTFPFLGLQLLAVILYLLVTTCTCSIGAIIALPMLSIYVQHMAYNKGILN